MSTDAKGTVLWRGRPLAELSREELIAAIEWLARDHQRMREQTQAMHPYVDWAAHLRARGSEAR